MLDHLSPTGFQLWRNDRRMFYLSYIKKLVPRLPPTLPMQKGKAFDWLVKQALHKELTGSDLDLAFEGDLDAGLAAMKLYVESGAYAALLLEMKGLPTFESTAVRTVDGVPLLGKPDLFFSNCVFDWKCSSQKAGGYVTSYPARKPGRDTIPMSYNGIVYNMAKNFEDVSESWAIQLFLYGLILDLDNPLVGIDCVGVDSVYIYRGFISLSFAVQIRKEVRLCWDEVENGKWEFDDVDPLELLMR